MKLLHFEKLKPVCPRCLHGSGQQFPLKIASSVLSEPGDVAEGILLCSNPQCLSEYPVIDGIPVIVPDLRNYISQNLLSIVMRDDLSESLESLIGDCCGASSAFHIRRDHLSAYAYDHYGDTDPEGHEHNPVSPGSVLKLLRLGLSEIPVKPDGPAIDMGCSVGRSTFEIARSAKDIVLGVDLNFAMLRTASGVLRRRTVKYPQKRTGIVFDRKEFSVILEGSKKIDFWACDICALPFTAENFGLALSLNTLDCVHSPYTCLQELERVLITGGNSVLTTPYDWSEGASPAEAWIGGHSQRSETRGAGETMLRSLLSGNEKEHSQSLKSLQILSEMDNVPWPVRIHERSVMQYWVHMLILGKNKSAQK